jgi:MFS family permease
VTADAIDRKRIFIAGAALFCLSSLLFCLTHNLFLSARVEVTAGPGRGDDFSQRQRRFWPSCMTALSGPGHSASWARCSALAWRLARW